LPVRCCELEIVWIHLPVGVRIKKIRTIVKLFEEKLLHIIGLVSYWRQLKYIADKENLLAPEQFS